MSNDKKSESDDKDVRRGILMKMYEEYTTRIRHYETQRSTLAGMIVVLAGALMGFVTFDKVVSLIDFPLTIFLTILGLFGAVFSAKQYERATRSAVHSDFYRKELDETLTGKPLSKVREEADAEHAKQFPQLSKFHIHELWIALHVAIAAIGLTLSILAIFGPRIASQQ